MRQKFHIAILLVLLPVLSGQAQSQTAPPAFSIKESEPRLGSRIKRNIAWSTTIPLNFRYHELSAEQRQAFHLNYEQIADGDEPPFPADGLRPIVEALSKAQRKLLVKGDLRLLVDVDANGDAISVSAVGSPSPEMTKVAASVLLLTKYKPALCAGQACKMQYPFNLSFRLE
jgi:hypothetical protein